MKIKGNKKMIYVSPTQEFTQVVLEEVIAASPVQKIDLIDWVEEGPDDDARNNADVWLSF